MSFWFSSFEVMYWSDAEKFFQKFTHTEKISSLKLKNSHPAENIYTMIQKNPCRNPCRFFHFLAYFFLFCKKWPKMHFLVKIFVNIWKSIEEKLKEAKKSGTPVESRTLNLLIRSQILYDLSIWKSTLNHFRAENIAKNAWRPNGFFVLFCRVFYCLFNGHWRHGVEVVSDRFSWGWYLGFVLERFQRWGWR